MNNGLIRKLGQVDREIRDPFKPEYYTHLEVFVPKPTLESRLPCILLSIRNGHRKLFFRLKNLNAYDRAFNLTGKERKRLVRGLETAWVQSKKIERYTRLSHNRHPGVSADVMLSEAEKIVRDCEREASGPTLERTD